MIVWQLDLQSRSEPGVQHYVIKFVSDLRQVGGFLRFPPPIKLTKLHVMSKVPSRDHILI
jgi:hypothetical protein